MNQQAQLEALAEQNRLLREALLKLACLGHGESYGNSIGNCIAQDALDLPDLSTSILNQRDARTIRDVAEKIKEAEPMLWDQYYRSMYKMAAEKEKS